MEELYLAYCSIDGEEPPRSPQDLGIAADDLSDSEYNDMEEFYGNWMESRKVSLHGLCDEFLAKMC
jgi:hypothetical protein